MREDKRKHWTPEKKVAILPKHRVERVAISGLCEQHQLKPSLFYRWQKEFFENSAVAFRRGRQGWSEGNLERQVAVLEARIGCKKAVIADLLDKQIEIKTEPERPSQ